MNLYTEVKQTHGYRKQTITTKEKKDRWIGRLEVWDRQIQTTKNNMDKYKYLLCVTGNYIQYFIIILMENYLKK